MTEYKIIEKYRKNDTMLTQSIAQRLKGKEKLSVRQIRQFFLERGNWDEDYSRLLARRALDMGENFLAYDIAEQIPIRKDTFVDRIHIMALALARSGSLKHAVELIGLLPESDDSEVVGLKSRILKDFALSSQTAEQRREYFYRAGQLSLDVFKSKHQYYNGINAASCLIMAGRSSEALALVSENVLPLCCKERNHDLWWHATMGECYLLLEDYSQAGKYYRKAAQIAIQEGQLGNLTSTLKQIYMLAEVFGRRRIDQIVEQMELPSIAVFSGHMIDHPSRIVPRFPAYAEEQVRNELAAIIKRRGIRMAYVSCACGGDIIFAEEVLKYGGECFLFPSLPIENEIKNLSVNKRLFF